jgi:glycosyltransferase involved in cell wall biosynthesis
LTTSSSVKQVWESRAQEDIELPGRIRTPILLWFLPYYPPSSRAGTEVGAHAINRFLLRKGYRVVVCSGNVPDSSFEGVEIVNVFSTRSIRSLVDEASLLLAPIYREYSDLALFLSRSCRKPLLHIVDSSRFRDRLAPLANVPDQYIVYGSECANNSLRLPHPSLVMRTPVDWREYQTATNRHYITLMNVNENKGGAVLVDLARRMPDKSFLGVMGAYGTMIVERGLPNLVYREQVEDVREVYALTGVLIMPSNHEAWGRTGVEAMSSGIPVVANPTPGLLESLSYAGLFCARDRLDDWVKTLRELESAAYYQEVSNKCIRRSRELDPADDLERLSAFIDRIIRK